jgi:hypothetical protein
MVVSRQKKLIIVVASVVVALLVIGGTVFALTRPEPVKPVMAAKPLVLESVPALIPPEPSAWIFPLTGVRTDDEAATLRRPLSIKVENTPEARPQTGLSRADVVYETITEGDITRFNCLFQSEIPQELGPVRSARLSDLFIVPQYDALFFFSGANPYVLDQIAAAGLNDMSHGAASSLYYRVNYREMPHNLYMGPTDAYGLAAEMGFATTTETPHRLDFAASAHAEQGAASDAKNVTVPFSSSYTAEWSWDEGSKTYLRSMNGASMDAATDQQIAATNVVVLWASYVVSADGLTYYVDLGDQGPASLFIDGKRMDGTWEGSADAPPRFKDANGNPLLLAPGKSWFQILNTGTDVTVAN